MRRKNFDNQVGGGPANHNFVTALARGLELLRCFGDAAEYLGNAELAKRTSIPRPTVSRMTATLTQLGYLLYMPNLERYRLGPRVLDLGYRYLASEGVRDIARPFMQDLADATDCFIAIGTPDGTDITYIQTCQGPGPLILRTTIGSRIPMAFTAAGHAVLAAMSPDEREYYYDLMQAEHPGDWPRIKQNLERAYDDYARHDFCMVEGEWNREVSAVAVPLRVENGQRVITFNCAGSSLRLSRQIMVENLGPRLTYLITQVREMLEGGVT